MKLNKLQKKIGISFKDVQILTQALTHKSFDTKNNYEKLEFLGDRVLGLIISKKLLDLFPDETEGIIDKKFANLVNKKTCESIAKKMNIKKFMFLGSSHKSLERSEDKVIGDCLEAIIGAIYLDSNLKSVERFVFEHWKEFLSNSKVLLIDPKTKLQEYSLKKFKKLPIYTFYKKTGPHHRPLFKTDVQIPESKKIIGVGSSKKNAQQDAAKRLLEILKIL